MLEVYTKVKGREGRGRSDIPMNWSMPLEWSYPGNLLEDMRAQGDGTTEVCLVRQVEG